MKDLEMSYKFRTFVLMKRKDKKIKKPITEENVKEAVEGIFDEMFIGEIMNGVYMVKAGKSQIIMGKEGFNLFAEELEKAMREEYHKNKNK